MFLDVFSDNNVTIVTNDTNNLRSTLHLFGTPNIIRVV